MDCFGAGYYVYGQPGVALEVAERTSSIGTEDSIDATCVESETAKAELEVGYVVASEHRSVQVEVAISQTNPCLHEGGLCGRVHCSMLVDASLGLEGKQCPGRIRPEVVVGHLSRIHRVADGQKATVEVPDRCSAIAGADRVGHAGGRRWLRSSRRDRLEVLGQFFE